MISGILNESELALLQEVEKTGRIPNEKWQLAYLLSSMGFLSLGFNDEDIDDFYETGRLTEISSELMRHERIRRSWFRRFLHRTLAPLFGDCI